MPRIQAIENALISINETVFQELCDSFLILKNQNYASFSRTGSQTGKQKTIKGTPDTLILQSNGRYMFVEFSTNGTKGISKLEDDVAKCFAPGKVKVNLEDLSEIVLCFNFNLSSEDIDSLKKKLPNDIFLTIYNLDRLALEICLDHRDLAHRYLGLPLDSGQIVSTKVFIEEYHKASNSIATPIDNPFLHREKETELLKQSICIFRGC